MINHCHICFSIFVDDDYICDCCDHHYCDDCSYTFSQHYQHQGSRCYKCSGQRRRLELTSSLVEENLIELRGVKFKELIDTESIIIRN